MDLTEVEQLISIIRDAQVSELTISTGTPQTTIRLRKPIDQAVQRRSGAKSVKSAGQSGVNSIPADTAQTVSAVRIAAPMVGIFHAIDNITTIGASIRAGQVVGAIESMKLMNDVLAAEDGTLTEIHVEDGMPVEYGQVLFVLGPQ